MNDRLFVRVIIVAPGKEPEVKDILFTYENLCKVLGGGYFTRLLGSDLPTVNYKIACRKTDSNVGELQLGVPYSMVIIFKVDGLSVKQMLCSDITFIMNYIEQQKRVYEALSNSEIFMRKIFMRKL